MNLEKIKDYHIHIYYGPETIDIAKKVASEAADMFGLELGRFHEKNVGPHPRWSVQLLVAKEKFAESLSWVALNRDGLTIFTHPNTGYDLEDHRDHAIWMGECLDTELELSIFKK